MCMCVCVPERVALLAIACYTPKKCLNVVPILCFAYCWNVFHDALHCIFSYIHRHKDTETHPCICFKYTNSMTTCSVQCKITKNTTQNVNTFSVL